MWGESLEIADKSLNTEFVQQLRVGTLDPTKFGLYLSYWFLIDQVYI